MTTTLAPVSGFQKSADRPRRLHLGPHAKKVATAIGVTPLYAQKLLNDGELPRRFAAVVRVFIEAGDHEGLCRWMRSTDDALSGIEVKPLTPDLEAATQELDLTEDIAQARYDADPTRDNLRVWQAKRLQAKAAERVLDCAIAEALAR